MPPPAVLDTHTVVLVLAPGTIALSRVLSTARSRGIVVRGAVYAEQEPGQARLQLDITADRAAAERAVLQLSRVVDVRSARMT